VFSDPSNARDFLLEYLPEQVRACIDLASISVHQKSYVDEELKKTHSDVLIEYKLECSVALIYVLIEHKSAPEKWTIFQLLKYMIRICNRHLSGITGNNKGCKKG